MMVNHDHTRIRQVQRIMISRSVVKRPRLCQAHRSHQNLTSQNIQWRTVELQWRHIEIVAGSIVACCNLLKLAILERKRALLSLKPSSSLERPAEI